MRPNEAGRCDLLTNPQLDPMGKIPELKFCAAKVEPVRDEVLVAAEQASVARTGVCGVGWVERQRRPNTFKGTTLIVLGLRFA